MMLMKTKPQPPQIETSTGSADALGEVDLLCYRKLGIDSIVSEAAEEIVTVGGRKCVLCHAFCTASVPPILKEELVEGEDAS